jgi:YfiH family protein
MCFIKNDHFIGYFGNIQDNLYHHGHYDNHAFLKLIDKITYHTQQKIKTLYFPKQIHTAVISIVENSDHIQTPLHLFHEQADAVITQEKNMVIGVVTADCLPIFLYDPINQAIGVIHAGWRGLAAKIITATISKMHSHFKTDQKKLQVYLGPSAGVCCYEVQDDFLSHFPSTTFNQKIIEKRNERYFFNPKKSALIELMENQVLENHINHSENVCTICDTAFCSVRRQKEKAGRQPAVMMLT